MHFEYFVANLLKLKRMETIIDLLLFYVTRQVRLAFHVMYHIICLVQLVFDYY